VFAEHDLQAGAVRIRYREAGHGPPLVHLAGLGNPGLTRGHELLAERFRVISIDPSGLGQSPTGEDPRLAQDLARTVAEALSRLGLERFSVLGTSFGGTVALWLALQFPERVEALVLESPTAIGPESSTASSGPGEDPELERQLGGLPVPVLVLLGTADSIVPPEVGRIYRATLPSCHFVLVYAAAHAISADRPEAFAELVGDFLERREQFIVTRTSGLVHP
jgi:pimeloyl-ACP methyl ester carboxylesterase